MNTHPCLVDMDTLRNEFPDARQLSDLDRARLLAFWAEVGYGHMDPENRYADPKKGFFNRRCRWQNLCHRWSQ